MMGRIGIVLPHPLHKRSIRVESAKTVTKSSVLHCLIRCRTMTSHILVHDVCPRETALNGNSAIAMRLHQALEEAVA